MRKLKREIQEEFMEIPIIKLFDKHTPTATDFIDRHIIQSLPAEVLTTFITANIVKEVNK